MTSPSSPGSILTCDTRPALPGPARLHPSRHAGRFRPNSRTGESDTGSKGHYRVRWNSRFGYREESDLLAMVGGDRVPPRGCSVHALLGFAARRSFPVEPVAKLCCAPSPQHVVLRAYFVAAPFPVPLSPLCTDRCCGVPSEAWHVHGVQAAAPHPPHPAAALKARRLEEQTDGRGSVAHSRTGECSTPRSLLQKSVEIPLSLSG